MQKTVLPSVLKSDASVFLPSSKSLSHRALITASLAQGTSLISNLSPSQDITATKRVLAHIGTTFEEKGNSVLVHGQKNPEYDGSVLDCGESGSTLRFLIPLFSLADKEAIFTGHGQLMHRPQSVYAKIFHEHGLLFDFQKNTLHIKGPIPAGSFSIAGDVSSQFISGLLFALPLLKEDSKIQVLEPFESRSYVFLTIEMLKKAGITIQNKENTFYISGRQTYHPFSYTVDGDDSQAAFFASLGLIHHEPVILHHLNHASAQGDHILYAYIEKMGGKVEETEDGYRILPGDLHGTEIDLADCPDLGPALFSLASQCRGTTHFLHTQRLRIKESDRIAAMSEEMTKLGCFITSDEDTVTVQGISSIKGNATVSAHNDHRIAMSLAVIASIADGPVTINEAESVNKSYPAFFEDLADTGVQII